MYALTYFIPTGALSTFIRGIALAAILITVVIACAAVAPMLWPLCCTIAAVVAVTMAVPFVVMKVK